MDEPVGMNPGPAGLRRQYHFQPDDDGHRAWDVHRLIELAADLPVVDVRLDTIDLDTNHWFDEFSPPTVRSVILHAELIDACDLSYPIILGADGRVMDGMHRIAKAVMQGRTTVPARQFTVDPEPDHRNCRAADLDYTPR